MAWRGPGVPGRNAKKRIPPVLFLSARVKICLCVRLRRSRRPDALRRHSRENGSGRRCKSVKTGRAGVTERLRRPSRTVGRDLRGGLPMPHFNFIFARTNISTLTIRFIMNPFKSNLFAVLFPVFAPMLLGACSDDDGIAPGADELHVSGVEQEFTIAASDTGQISFTVESNREWQLAASGLEWAEVSPAGGAAGLVQVKITPYSNLGDLRTGTIAIRAGTQEHVITIHQQPSSDTPSIVVEGLTDGGVVCDAEGHAAEFQGQCQRGVGGRDGGSRLGRRHTFEGRSRHVRPHRGYARGERRGRAERYADHPGRPRPNGASPSASSAGCNPGHRRRRPYR